MGAKVPHECARVDLGQHGDRVAFHVLVGHLLGAPVGADGGELAHDQAFDVRARGLVICLVGAVVSDLGIGENDDLPGVGGIGGDLLVAG